MPPHAARHPDPPEGAAMMALGASLVASLFGGSSGGTVAGNAASAIAALKSAQASGAEARGVAQERKDPVTITALKQFEAALAKAKDAGAALQDPRVLAVLLPALGLADQAQYPGLVRKALLADPDDPKGLLAGLDSRFKAAASMLDLKDKGLAGLRAPALKAKLADAYVQYQYQRGLDEANAGMSDALYFIRSASGGTDVYGILGNAVMRRVVTGALGLPAQMAVQPVETQARAISARLKLADLQDPRKVQQLAQRYVMAQAGTGTGTGTGTSGSLLSLLG